MSGARNGKGPRHASPYPSAPTPSETVPIEITEAAAPAGPPAPAGAQETAPIEMATHFCSNCGRELTGAAKFCSNCGTVTGIGLAAVTASPAATLPPPPAPPARTLPPPPPPPPPPASPPAVRAEGEPVRPRGPGLPVWALAAIGAAVVAILVVGAVFLFGGGGDDDGGSSADTGDTVYVGQVKRPLGQLTSSVVAVGKGLARADAPADLRGLNRLAERQIDVVEAARRTLSGVEVTSADRPSQQRLIKAAADQRRFLVALDRATSGTPTEASLKALNRARSAAGQTIASYRAFFAITPGAADAITATDITDTSGVRAAIQQAIADNEPPSPNGGATVKAPANADGTYGGGSFQSPTGNLRCQISGSTLFCSSSNDGFGVSLPGFGAPTTGTGVASGGVTVPYGSTWSSGQFSCQSDFDGITCSNQSGNGFFLNRDTFRPF